MVFQVTFELALVRCADNLRVLLLPPPPFVGTSQPTDRSHGRRQRCRHYEPGIDCRRGKRRGHPARAEVTKVSARIHKVWVLSNALKIVNALAKNPKLLSINFGQYVIFV